MSIKTVFAVCLSLLCFSVSTSFAANAPLDGKTFAGEIKEGDSKPDPDTFEFKNGTFHSTACDEYGYKVGEYNASENNGKISFNAHTKNDKGATIAWNGTVHGTAISGTAVMTDTTGEKTTMAFNGTLKK